MKWVWLIINYTINLLSAPFIILFYLLLVLLYVLLMAGGKSAGYIKDNGPSNIDFKVFFTTIFVDMFAGPLLVAYRYEGNVSYFSDDAYIIAKLENDEGLIWRDPIHRNLIATLFKKGH